MPPEGFASIDIELALVSQDLTESRLVGGRASCKIGSPKEG